MVNVMVERATNDMLIGPDWAMNLEICDMLNRDPSQAKDVVKGIKKKLGSKNPKVQLLALTLLETLVKNCGDIVHLHVAEKDVLHELVRIVKKKPDFHVKDKILILIDTWQEAFGGPRARYPQYYAAYQELLRAGAVFPQRSESEAPVFTPPQTQPLSTYPPNVRNSDFPQETPAEPSSQSHLPTLSATEIQNARGIMDVLSEMLSALDPGNKAGLRQEVIVDLVEQCRTYKQRVVHLVTNTSDETLMFQGLALSDDLDRVLVKHDAIASGAPIRVEQPRTEPARELVPINNLLIDTGDSSKEADKRPISTGDAGAQAEPSFLALPAPTTITSTPPSVKLDPKIDLLSGDDYNSPTAQSNLALVPSGEAQPVSPLSQQNALILVDFYSESNMTNSSGAQPSYHTGQTHLSAPPFNQQQNLSSSQPMQYTNGIPQFQQQNPQSSQYMLYTNGSAQNPQQNSHMSQPPLHANGSAQNPGVALYEQSSYTQSGTPDWNGQQQQQQQPPPSSVYGSQSDSSFPPPPWEAQPVESNAQYPDMQVNTQVQQTVPYGHQNGMYPQVEQMGNGMYTHLASQSFQNNQYIGMQPQQMPPGQMYPQQMYGYQMQGYGYGQQQDPRLLQQQMSGLSMTSNNGSSMTNYYPTSSAASYSSASKPKKPEDKLFGDLVDISKFKSAKSTAG
ncbi:unnamed protein product [Rhodiola kirilowii]